MSTIHHALYPTYADVRRELRGIVPFFDAQHIPMVSHTVEEVVSDSYGLLSVMSRVSAADNPIDIIDIGSNFGLWSFGAHTAAKRRGITTVQRHILVEPMPHIIKKSYELLDTVSMFPFEYGCHALGCGESVSMSAGPGPMQGYASAGGDTSIKSYAMPFSEVIAQYDLIDGDYPLVIKIDCEGGEKTLLRPEDGLFFNSLLRTRICAVGLELHLGGTGPYYQAPFERSQAGGSPVSLANWDSFFKQLPDTYGVAVTPHHGSNTAVATIIHKDLI
jgi:FkbM family methyltransferase